jgi:hypothetical protein
VTDYGDQLVAARLGLQLTGARAGVLLSSAEQIHADNQTGPTQITRLASHIWAKRPAGGRYVPGMSEAGCTVIPDRALFVPGWLGLKWSSQYELVRNLGLHGKMPPLPRSLSSSAWCAALVASTRHAVCP